MFENEIQKGIEFMEKYDKAWFNKINLDTLCMFNNVGCVLSQWLKGDPTTIFSNAFTIAHGFMIDEFENENEQVEWIILKQEWTEQIKAKRREMKIATKIKTC